MAYAHTYIQHSLDQTLTGSIQHQWKCGHRNIKPEQMWLRFRKTWVPGFEQLLDKGLEQQWYNIVNITDRCVTMVYMLSTHVHASYYPERFVFRWLAIPWLQWEADSYVYGHNTLRRRADRRKVLPSGVPDVMFKYPESVDALDFKVSQHPNEELCLYL